MSYAKMTHSAVSQNSFNTQRNNTQAFTDQRTSTNEQLQLQSYAHTSPRVAAQLALQKTITPSQTPGLSTATNSPLQLKTNITHTKGSFSYHPYDNDNSTYLGATNEVVGTQMEAWLDPNDPVVGTSPGSDQQELMTSLKKRYNLKAHELIKGHLLNHDLGGYGVAQNLFPITKKANAEHLVNAEYGVKQALIEAKKQVDGYDGVYYFVKVKGPMDDVNYGKATTLECHVNKVTDIDDKRKIGEKVAKVEIESKVDAPSGSLDEAYDMDSGDLIDRFKNPGAMSTWQHRGSGADPTGFGRKSFKDEQKKHIDVQ